MIKMTTKSYCAITMRQALHNKGLKQGSHRSKCKTGCRGRWWWKKELCKIYVKYRRLQGELFKTWKAIWEEGFKDVGGCLKEKHLRHSFPEPVQARVLFFNIPLVSMKSPWTERTTGPTYSLCAEYNLQSGLNKDILLRLLPKPCGTSLGWEAFW